MGLRTGDDIRRDCALERIMTTYEVITTPGTFVVSRGNFIFLLLSNHSWICLPHKNNTYYIFQEIQPFVYESDTVITP